MSASKYPRPGYRIAPSSLREILDDNSTNECVKKLSDKDLKLSELDEGSWTRFGTRVCRELGRCVVKLTASRAHRLPNEILNRRLPSVPQNLNFEDLRIEIRTRNCLKRLVQSGVVTRPMDLGNLTISDILETRAFGAKSLVDLLSSLETEAAHTVVTPNAKIPDVAPNSGPSLDHSLTREASKLRGMDAATRVFLDDPRLASNFGSFARAAASIGENWSLSSHWSIHDVAGRIANRKHDPIEPTVLVEQIRNVRKSISRLLRTNLEKELRDLVLVLSDRRTADIVTRFFGWDTCTLQVAGNEFGITRERVRQISERFIERLPKTRCFLPCLDQALSRVDASLPTSASDMEKALVQRGLTNRPFRLEGLLTAAKLLHRRANFGLEALHKQRFATSAVEKHLARDIVRIARQSITHWGIATTADVAEQLAEKRSKPSNLRFVSNVLQAIEDLTWLDQERCWFWLPSVPRNRLVNQIGKILAVSSEINVSELRAGISRYARMQGFAPPRRVLTELCRKIPMCRVEGDRVFANTPLVRDELLGETELLMVKILNENGPLLERGRFQELCVAAGMNPATFMSYLANSPIISRYAPGVYGLTGIQFPVGLIESMLAKRRPSKVLLDYGWTDDRKIWVAYKLSRGIINSGVIGIPSPMASFLQGEFVLRDEGGSRVGTIVSKKSQAWGLGPFFRRRGGEVGDFLLLVFNLEARDAQLAVGDESLVEGPQDDGQLQLKT